MKTLTTLLLITTSIVFAQQKAKTYRTKTKLEPEMVLVQGGTFYMGSDTGVNDELPIHNVSVSRFKMGKYEVTQAQWKAVMGANPSKFNTCATCPVENVNWYDVQEYLKKLNAITHKKYRLPTEAEWEYAARGGNKSKNYSYSGSNIVDEASWYKGNSKGKTEPCGSKKPNELGLYDMNGNVWEWCNDWYSEKDTPNSPDKNPQGSKSGTLKILSGGCWYLDSSYCRLGFRYYDNPKYNYEYVGFRIVVSEH